MPARFRGIAALLAVVALAVLFTWGQRFGEDRQPADTLRGIELSEGPDSPGATAAPVGADEIAYSALPAEARAVVLAIEDGGPFAYDRDGITFGNREGLLPKQPRGFYREYTVPTPGSSDRGARRIVAGEDGFLFYTDDHYASFRLIRVYP